jgi:hypothetical protein
MSNAYLRSCARAGVDPTISPDVRAALIARRLEQARTAKESKK